MKKNIHARRIRKGSAIVTAILQASGLTKKYGDFTAVDGIDFEVSEDEIFGFLGPNGAGKTTTINMLTGAAKITSGLAKVSDFNCDRQIKKASLKKLINGIRRPVPFFSV
ncbi:MAG: ATP-binding cassette domain-containing protein [Dethiobacter sp.]|jgi:ABC-type multidrug transport system ATPase subunit|nr:ATP-binding cassette domain-containing protein [Dethiobacter sp.]